VMRYGKNMQRIPGFMRKGAAAIMDAVPANAIPIFNKKYLFHSRYEKLRTLLKNPSGHSVLMSLTSQMNDGDIANLFKKPVNKLLTSLDSEELGHANYSILAYMMAIDYQTYLLDDILQKVDRATMSVSLEGREPFLDQRIIEWAAQLPMKYKYNNGNKKFIIKEIVHKYLPVKMMDRPKMGFGIPIANWLLNELKPFVDQYLDEAFVLKQNVFNNTEIQSIKKSFYGGKVEKTEKIWYLLMFQMWYDKWMNKN
jgi:asparagine synthase (glutamine-hydrolysing)